MNYMTPNSTYLSFASLYLSDAHSLLKQVKYKLLIQSTHFPKQEEMLVKIVGKNVSPRGTNISFVSTFDDQKWGPDVANFAIPLPVLAWLTLPRAIERKTCAHENF